jgi:hypothetical protein
MAEIKRIPKEDAIARKKSVSKEQIMIDFESDVIDFNKKISHTIAEFKRRIQRHREELKK